MPSLPGLLEGFSPISGEKRRFVLLGGFASYLMQIEEFARPKDPDASPRIKFKQVVVAGDEEIRSDSRCEFEIDVILAVAAIRDNKPGFDPHRRIREEMQYLLAVSQGDMPAELGAAQNAPDLRFDRCRECDHILLPSPQDGLARNAIALQRRSNDSAGIDDDQLRRSAL